MMHFVVALQSFVVTFQCSGSRTRRCALNPRLLQPVNANPALQLVRGGGCPARNSDGTGECDDSTSREVRIK
jgi:hypothetical protein